MSPKAGSPPGTPDSLSRPQPRPRPLRSPAETAQIRVRNRRREYLERNQEYFKSADQELADPLLYDNLIRRFQTPAEREAEGRSRGYARVLEGSLMRGEERLARMAGSWKEGSGSSKSEGRNGSAAQACGASNPRSSAGTLDEETLAEEPPADKEDGRARWEVFLRERFVRGGDEDFDYAKVDETEEYDVLERKDKEDAWFDDETPRWAGSSEEDGGEDGSGPVLVQVERRLEGQTGIQDF